MSLNFVLFCFSSQAHTPTTTLTATMAMAVATTTIEATVVDIAGGEASGDGEEGGLEVVEGRAPAFTRTNCPNLLSR